MTSLMQLRQNCRNSSVWSTTDIKQLTILKMGARVVDHRLQQKIVRGVREAKALPEEQRSGPFLHRGRKLKSLRSRVLVLGERTKCSKKCCTTRGELHKALNTHHLFSVINSERSSDHT